MNQRLGFLAIAALVGAGLPGSVRADKLDNRLNEEIPGIVKQLKEKGYKNVGVLRFRVQQGNDTPTFTTPLSGTMAARIETFLVIHGGLTEEDALGVIHDAGPAAFKQKITTWYRSPTGRRKLFAGTYPLAWGNRKVKADVFLTGQVKVSKDVRTTTVILQSFDQPLPGELVELGKFSFKTDRNILRELGYSFALNLQARSRLVARRSTSAEADDLVFEQLPKQGGKKDPENKKDPEDKKDPENKKDLNDKKDPEDKGQQSKKQDTGFEPKNVGGLEVQMLADGKAREIRPGGGEGDKVKWQVTCPAPGQRIAFRLKNTSSRTIGVVLRMNGVNTVNQQKDEPERCRKWIIDAGKFILVDGYYMLNGGEPQDSPAVGERGKKAAKRGDDDDPVADDREKTKNKPDDKSVKAKVIPFKVLVGDAAKTAKSEMGDRGGLIEVDVFEVGSERQEPMVSGKGLPPSKERKARASYISLRNALLKSARLKTTMVAKREVIVPDDSAKPEPGPGIKVVKFENPQFVARIAVRVMPGGE